MASDERDEVGPWGPRPNDHLVEPFFSGLGLEGEADEVLREERSGEESARGLRERHSRGWLGRLIARVRRR